MSKRRTEGGFKRANPCAPNSNAIKLPACLPCNDAICEDRIEVDLGEKLIKGFVYSETNEPILFPEPITADQFEMAFCKAVQSHETEEGVLSYEYNIVAGSEVDGDTTTIYHVGQTTVSAIILDDDSVVEATRYCTLVNVCTFQQFYVGTGAQIVTTEGTKVLEGEFNYTMGDDVANETAAEALAAAVAACLETLGTDFEGVEVSPDDVNEGFTISVDAQKPFEAYIGGKKLENCGCTRCYVEEATEEVETETETETPKKAMPATTAPKADPKPPKTTDKPKNS